MHYKRLEETYKYNSCCKETLRNSFRHKWSYTIDNKHQLDAESKLGVYKSINPEFHSYLDNTIPEYERIQVTRYRTGSHNLQIEKGRHTRTPRDERKCSCTTDVQTLNHVVFKCSLTERIPEITKLNEFFELDRKSIISYINKFTKVLKIKD